MSGEHSWLSGLEEMLAEVFQGCVDQFSEGDEYAALNAFRRKRADLCQAFTRDLGQASARYLAAHFRPIKSIYRFEIDPGGVRAQDQTLKWTYQPGLHLVVWTGEENASLEERLDSFQDRLAELMRQKGLCSEDNHLPVEIRLVDDEQVRDQIGFGVFPSGEIIRSQKIYPRDERTPRMSERGGVEKTYPTGQGPLLEELSSFDPKLAPEDRILRHAQSITSIPPERRGALQYHLMELKVNLIRKIISDQLGYLNIAKSWFRVEDLEDLYQRRIGSGKIGGKAAGMMLAYRILQEAADREVRGRVHIPPSYFLGSDLIYIYMAMNGLMHWNDQKYKPEHDIRSQYEQIQEEFLQGDFPPEVIGRLRGVLDEMGDQPVIVRSSSQLEDNFGTAFAGKYDSFFLPNQGTPEENLEALLRAIARTYASTLKPEALLYRRRRGLQDYDERMAVLIQAVQGERWGRYFLPHAAGVAFSRNLYRWSPEIRREDGFTRLVWGLGTRAVGRMGEDYPRLVALSHPHLQPDDSAEAVRRYSQRKVDLIDLETNQFRTLPVQQVLTPRYRPLPYLIQLDQGGYLAVPRMRVKGDDLQRAALTFQKLITDTPFIETLKEMLTTLETHYHDAVDVEYTLQIPDPRDGDGGLAISLLQCRPQPHLADVYDVQFPAGLSEERIIFSSSYLVPRGYLSSIHYVVFVKPEVYYALETAAERTAVARAIGALNEVLGRKEFICLGPGRWGSVNPDLGVFVSYGDIHNAGALIELCGENVGPAPEPSLGTHFFQDLMEAEIYPLVINFDDQDLVFNRDFFTDARNTLSRWVDVDPRVADCLQVIEVAEARPGHHLELIMDDQENKSLAYLVRD